MSIHYRVAHPPKDWLNSTFYPKLAPIITGVGAAIVILGALFKIMHWPGAAPMLIVGLGTEAVLFLLFAFAPQPTEPDWTILYPELGADAHATGHAPKVEKKKESTGVTKKLDDLLTEANISPESLQRLGAGFESLSSTVSQLGTITNAAVASDEYSKNVLVATSTIQELNKAYSTTVSAMSSMADSSTDAKEYHVQVQNITKNLSALNAVYELELQDVNVHLKSINKFYGSLSSVIENVTEAGTEAQVFKSELTRLTSNLSSLNNIYGNMLTAIKNS